MFESEINVNKFLLGYVDGLLKELPDERLTEQPLPGVNHPAWIMGHLVYTADAITGLMGGEKILSHNWTHKFGPNSELSTQRADYPSKAELQELLRARFEAAQDLARKADPAAMAVPNPRTHMSTHLPRLADLVAFIFTGHMGVHAGQLSTWRRLIGLSRLF